MSAESNTRSGTDDLQFDRAVDPDAATGTPVCAACNAAIRMYYYDVDGATTCSSCKQAADRANGGGARSGGMLKATLYGLGAAVAGAIIYYSVMEYLDLEIGYVAILIGFMVGYAVRAAVAGRGGRRFQLLAAGLTYFAVALAYTPFSIRGFQEASDEAVADSSVTADAGTDASGSVDAAGADETVSDDAADDGVAVDAASAPGGLGAAGVAIGVAGGLLFILALPIVVILGSMPSGLISALIIGIGMHQAWNMTRALELTITGPFKVGSARSPAAA